MLVEIHFVYRNNDVSNNSLENSCFSNALEDNERMARKRKLDREISLKRLTTSANCG